MYVKLFASLYQGTLRGKSDEILVFTNLLAHADKHGIVDKHWRAISEETGLSKEQVQAAIKNLEAPDIESRSPEMNGARITRLDEHRAWGWMVVNYEKYRAIRNEDDRREQNRIAQERWRNKHLVSNVSRAKPLSAQAEAEADTEAKAKASKSNTAPGKPALKILLDLGVPEQAAIDWLAVRKAKRAPLTQTVIDELKREAAKAGITVAQAVLICARKSWQGFNAAWDWSSAAPAKTLGELLDEREAKDATH